MRSSIPIPTWNILVVGRSVTNAVDPATAVEHLINYVMTFDRGRNMIITPLRVPLIPAVEHLIGLGAPYVWPRTSSDYWLYAELFSSTCPVAMDNDDVIGVVIAFRSQNKPDDVYVQDVMSHPDHRRRGIARALLDTVHQRASTWGCHRLYLTSEPDNSTAHVTWLSLGFSNIRGDRITNGVSVISNYKGQGKDRAVYELKIK